MGWQVKLAGSWTDFSPEEAKQLEAKYRSGLRSFTIVSRNHKYVISLEESRWVQKNLSTGKSRDIRLWNPAPDPESPTEHDHLNPLLGPSVRSRDNTGREIATSPLAVGLSDWDAIPHIRVYVWLSGEWKPVSSTQLEQIQENLEKRYTKFDIVDGNYRFTIDTTGKDGWVQIGKKNKRKMKCDERAAHFGRSQKRGAAPSEEVTSPAGPCRAPKRKSKTEDLLEALRGEWKFLSSGKKMISQDDVVSFCRRSSGDAGHGALDIELIEQSAKDMFRKMDLGQNKEIDADEYLHYRLLEITAPSFYALSQVNEKLLHWCRLDASVLRKYLELFAQSGARGEDPRLDAGQMRSAASNWRRQLRTLMSRPGVPTDAMVTDVLEYLTELTNDEASGELLEEDATLTYYDYMNHLLGRRKARVQIYLYDILSGKTKWLAPLLLCRQIEGLWHSGIVTHGKEYWFGGSIFESEPGTTPFGVPTKIVDLSLETMRTRNDLWNFIRRELASEYTRTNYDVLTHNCNHFSDALSLFLVNKHLDDEVLKQPEMVMGSVVVRLLRPLLNRWLGTFGEETSSSRTTEEKSMEAEWSAVRENELVTYEYEEGWNCIARVLTKDGEVCKLMWLDLQSQGFIVLDGVSRVRVSTLKQSPAKHVKNAGMGLFCACYNPPTLSR